MVAYGYFDTVCNNSPSVTGRMVNIDEIYKFKRQGKMVHREDKILTNI